MTVAAQQQAAAAYLVEQVTAPGARDRSWGVGDKTPEQVLADRCAAACAQALELVTEISEPRGQPGPPTHPTPPPPHPKRARAFLHWAYGNINERGPRFCGWLESAAVSWPRWARYRLGC